MPKPPSPTQRTVAHFAEQGITCDVVEYWQRGCFRRKDLLGFIDIVVCHPEQGIIGIQATDGDHAANRVKKIVSPECREKARAWLKAGAKIEVWGWRYLRRSDSWAANVKGVTLEDLE